MLENISPFQEILDCKCIFFSEEWSEIIGIDDYIYSNNCITMIEWGNLHPDLLPDDAIFLEFKHVDENKRHIRIRK